MLSNQIPQIRISLDPREHLDPGLKKEISQQVREFRAQKLSQRGRSPGHIQNHNQAAGQVASKGPGKSHKEPCCQEPTGQSSKLPNPYPVGASQQKEKPRDRPLSAPSQAAIQALMSASPQLKALQPHPQSPRQVPKPQPGSNPASAPAVKAVSERPRGRSHSPRCRIDVEVEPWEQGGWQRGMRPAVSDNAIMFCSKSEVTKCNPGDPFSQSFPDSALQSALSRHRDYSPASSCGTFLQVPDYNHLYFHSLDKNGRDAVRCSASTGELSASAPADVLGQQLAEVRQMRSLSCQSLHSSSASTAAACWVLPPQRSPQSSSSGSLSTSTLSPPFSPDSHVSNMAFQPNQAHLLMPTCHHHVSAAASTGHSPYHSPFGSQIQICTGSPGREF